MECLDAEFTLQKIVLNLISMLMQVEVSVKIHILSNLRASWSRLSVTLPLVLRLTFTRGQQNRCTCQQDFAAEKVMLLCRVCIGTPSIMLEPTDKENPLRR